MKEKSTKEKKRKINQLLTNKAVLISISYILTDPMPLFVNISLPVIFLESNPL